MTPTPPLPATRFACASSPERKQRGAGMRAARFAALMTGLWMASGMVCAALAQNTDQASATALRAKFNQLGKALQNSPFGRPIVLESTEISDRVQGDVYAVVHHPYAKVQQALSNPASWCDVMILHNNTKQCIPPKPGAPQVLKLSIGKKDEQPVDKAYQMDMAYTVQTSTSDDFKIQLRAPDGPLGTSDYRVLLEVVSSTGDYSLLHLTYSYASSMASKMATKVYMATVARSKVGFSQDGTDGDGQPRYINGIRGAVERNAMRYYLAIDVYLQSLNAPANEQLEQRFQGFYNAMEQYHVNCMKWTVRHTSP